MPNVVVAGGLIQCSHKGIVKLSGGDARLAIAGAAALTAGMEAGLSFAIGAPGVVTPCPLPAPSGPPSSSACNATFAATAGLLHAADGRRSRRPPRHRIGTGGERQ